MTTLIIFAVIALIACALASLWTGILKDTAEHQEEYDAFCKHQQFP